MSLNILSNLSRVVGQVSKEKGVSQEVVIDSIVQGVLTAVRKKYGTYRDIEVKYNEEVGELELFEFKKVVSDEEFEDELIEIKYSSAKELDPSAHIGDQMGMRLELKDLGRIDAQAARQIIIQNLRSIEHEIIFNEFEKRKGEIANGVVRRVDPGMIVVDLDKTEAYIPRKEQIPGEQYKSGDRIQGYLLEVRQTTRGPQIIMSRAHEQYLIKLFENEVPEVNEGIVKIVSAAREPGQRAKMSVYSVDSAVHPVGSCVGIKGSRVQNITQELKGERIDVIVWENDPVQYICNALAPAKISKILVDEDRKSMQIIVPDDQLSLAIGKKGQNVRLAVKLTNWNLNLISEEESKKAKKEALFNLSLIPEMTETKAQSLFQYGYSHLEQLSTAKPADLKDIPEFEDPAVAESFIKSAKKILDEFAKEGKELPKLQDSEQEKKPLSSSLKEQAEEILKRELAQLEGDKKTDKPVESSKESEKTVKEPAKAQEEKKASSEKPESSKTADKSTDQEEKKTDKKEASVKTKPVVEETKSSAEKTKLKEKEESSVETKSSSKAKPVVEETKSSKEETKPDSAETNPTFTETKVDSTETKKTQNLNNQELQKQPPEKSSKQKESDLSASQKKDKKES